MYEFINLYDLIFFTTNMWYDFLNKFCISDKKQDIFTPSFTLKRNADKLWKKNTQFTILKIRERVKVGELAAEEVRWFYKPEADKIWIPFDGYDSLRYHHTKLFFVLKRNKWIQRERE